MRDDYIDWRLWEHDSLITQEPDFAREWCLHTGQDGNLADRDMRPLMDIDRSRTDLAARFAGWKYTYQDLYNHAVIGRVLGGDYFGESLCGLRKMWMKDWAPESQTLLRCDQCVDLFPKIYPRNRPPYPQTNFGFIEGQILFRDPSLKPDYRAHAWRAIGVTSGSTTWSDPIYIPYWPPTSWPPNPFNDTGTFANIINTESNYQFTDGQLQFWDESVTAWRALGVASAVTTWSDPITQNTPDWNITNPAANYRFAVGQIQFWDNVDNGWRVLSMLAGATVWSDLIVS